jgi:DNA-binding NtrC family response regulator
MDFDDKIPGPAMIGRSPAFVRVLGLIDRMARFDAPVLIVGETGTGKELAARALHYRSARAHAPFVPLNCGAIPESLIESELFGCERGAFTDARAARTGLVAAAQGGTLFLDEVDALVPRAQVALLRFLQDRRYRPVGATREQHGDVRVIAAASPRLRALLDANAFRDDLAFRLNVLRLEMPPLRERPGDALQLAGYFAERHARVHRLAARPISAASITWLERYAWPGNVRELDNVVQRALLLADGDPHPLLLGEQFTDAGMGLDGGAAAGAGAAAPMVTFNAARDVALAAFERRYLQALMQATDGNVTHAARVAGKERRALGKLLKKHGLARHAVGG